MIVACAHDPIVDTKGVDQSTYNRDLAEWRDYAQQVNTAGEAGKYGAAGAVIGGAVGAILGDSRSAARGAGVGAVSGATKGGHRAEQRKERVVFNCLRGRGYKVLG